MRERATSLLLLAENIVETAGLLGSILISCTIGALIAAAGIDLDYLARQTAVLSFLALLTFGSNAVYHHRDPVVTGLVGVGIGQGILFFFTDVPETVLSVMCDVIIILTIAYLARAKKP